MSDEEKKGETSFGAIVATIGAVLIALGVAWLIALNWAAIPGLLKILILVFLTGAAYTCGVMFRISGYQKIGQSLLILGALLYTLSIFLIAQIFSTNTSAQGIAWLWMLAFVGVFISGYIFSVPSLLGIAIAEFVFWLFYQSFAFTSQVLSENAGSSLLVSLFLTVGILTAVGAAGIIKERKNEMLMLFFASIVSLVILWLLLFVQIISSLQGAAWILLLIVIIYIVFAYVGGSKTALMVGFTGTLFWIGLQYVSLIKNEGNFAIGILVLAYLFFGILFYGLTQLHKARNHIFTEAYRYWTALYVLILTYLLSFQTILPYLWTEKFELTPGILVFLVCIGISAAIAAVTGIFSAVNVRKLTGKEVIGFIALVGLYIILIAGTALLPEQSFYLPFGGQGISGSLFTFWIFDNILFIFVILAVVGYGTRYKSPNLVNLAIAFFALDIITRYIGFIMDYGGQVGFAVISIIGGIILVAGGWLIEKWRRRLIQRTAEKSNEYAIY